jgi:site-specific DNA recombinase
VLTAAKPVPAPSVFIEMFGECPELLSLVTVGECEACREGTCRIAFAYLRISKDKYIRRGKVLVAVEDDEDEDTGEFDAPAAGRGVVRQGRKMIRLSGFHKCSHVILFVDNNLSGSKVRKGASQWPKLVKRLADERPAFLLGLKYDRLGRRLGDLEGLEELCRTTGTKCWTVADKDLFASTVWPILAGVAKTYALDTAFRVQEAQEARMEKGLDPGGGNRPYGFAADRLTLIPAEVDVIKEAAKRVIEGETGSAICRDLNARGVPRAVGAKSWTPVVLRGILSRPRYGDSGEKDEHGRSLGMRTRNVGTRKEKRYEIVGPGAWPAILDRKTWDLLQAKLTATRGTKGRPTASLLGGIARCGYCETPLYIKKVSNTRPNVYRCDKAIGGCGKVCRTAGPIDEYVSARALNMISEEVNAGEAAALREAADRLSGESVEVEHRIGTLRHRFADGQIGDEDFYPTLDELRSAARKLDREYTATILKLDAVTQETTIRDRWDDMSTAQRRDFLKRRVRVVLVYRSVARGVAARKVGEGEVEIR